MNHKRVLRLMRADNLLAVRKQRFVFTTDSRHGYAVYPNLAARLNLTGVNQLWVARHHLRTTARNVSLSGDCAGCLFAPGDRLGTGRGPERRPGAGAP